MQFTRALAPWGKNEVKKKIKELMFNRIKSEVTGLELLQMTPCGSYLCYQEGISPRSSHNGACPEALSHQP